MPHAVMSAMRLIALCAPLAACAPGAIAPPTSKARVKEVYLYQHSVNVLMSDGSLCTATKPGGATRQWSGRLGGCAHTLAFSVTLAQQVNPVRLVLDEVGLSPILNPIAQVTVTESSGREVTFVSPSPA